MCSRGLSPKSIGVLIIFVIIFCSSVLGEEIGFTDCETCPVMVKIPKGTFNIRVAPWGPGHPHDEGYFYPVTFSYTFAIGKYETSFEMTSDKVAKLKAATQATVSNYH